MTTTESGSPSPAWTVRQVAEYLSVNERTVYRMAERGELPAFKVGDAWRFRREDIEAWIEGQQRDRGGDHAKGRRGKR
jgi:excisionase family DNA binding protein